MTLSDTTPFLLDANVLYRVFYQPGDISQAALSVLQNPGSLLLVSHATAWEALAKVHRAKASLTSALVQVDLLRMRRFGLDFVPIHEGDIASAIALPDIHRDPFDRMLIAQAQRLKATIVSSDRKLPLFGVPVIPL